MGQYITIPNLRLKLSLEQNLEFQGEFHLLDPDDPDLYANEDDTVRVAWDSSGFWVLEVHATIWLGDVLELYPYLEDYNFAP